MIEMVRNIIRSKNNIKKMFFLLIIFVFLFTSYAFAQNPINECINYLSVKDYQRAIKAGQRAVILYPKIFNAHTCLGIAYFNTGQLNSALESFKKAEIYATNEENLMFIYNWLGETYSKKGDLDNALLYHNRCLNLAKELGKKDLEAIELNNIALIFDSKGEFDKALNYYQESLKLKDHETEKATTYNNIAIIYSKKNEHQKAVNYLKKAIEIFEKSEDYHSSGITMLNLGNIYREMKDFDNAHSYLQEGLKRIQKIGDLYWEACAYRYFGLYFGDKGDKELAKDYMNKAYELFKTIGAEADANDALLSISLLKNKKTENKR